MLVLAGLAVLLAWREPVEFLAPLVQQEHVEFLARLAQPEHVVSQEWRAHVE